MSYTLLSATPSPYARKVRIALLEKGVPFTLRTEVPWHEATETRQHNPLEKLPVLIPEDGGEPVYESRFILEWLEHRHPTPPLLPKDPALAIEARRIEVVADGVCDAGVLLFFEEQRPEPSAPWMARQQRKLDGGVAWLARRIEAAGGGFLCGEFGLADIAAGAALGWLTVRRPNVRWGERYPVLSDWAARLEQRPSFAATRPVAQSITEAVV